MSGTDLVTRIAPVHPSERDAAVDLSGPAPWGALRYLARFGSDVAGPAQQSNVRHILGGPGLHLAARRGDELVAQASAVPNHDLGDHFGVPFHEVGPLATTPADRYGPLVDLLVDLVDGVATERPGVLVLRIEADDLDALRAAEDAGFRVRETTLTFVNDLERAHLNPPPPDQEVRVHRIGVDDPIDPEEFAHMRGCGSQFTHDHYHADPRLPDALCDTLYDRVFDRALVGNGADVLIMRYEEGRIASMGTWRHWHLLEEYGVSIAGSAFGFRSPRASPGNQGVTWVVCNESLTGNRLLEWSTQATNAAMVNMICQQPSIRHCRTSYVLHRWTDGRWG